jgi:hypothetical protein
VSGNKNSYSHVRSSLGSARRIRIIDAINAQGNAVRCRHVQRINEYDLHSSGIEFGAKESLPALLRSFQGSRVGYAAVFSMKSTCASV